MAQQKLAERPVTSEPTRENPCGPIGTEVIFEGSQAKDGSHRANGQHITLADGKKLFLGASGSEGAEDKK